jgi:transposase-like protein
MWLLEGEVVEMPRPYPPEFRQRALDLVRSGRSVPEVARLLGIAESYLYRWKRQDLADRGLKPATESADLTAARRKIRELEEENKILRKAAAAAAVEQMVP